MNNTMEEEENINPDDTFKIMIASDIHLGFMDGNPFREDDSFNTFEEILEIAKEQEVDFVLLGGDLFHENKPKPCTLKRAMDILQKHCFGQKPVQFEYLSDPKTDFKGLEVPEVNYYSPNVNIALPVFTIHGNHDDPIGQKKTSAVDHLAAAKLLNHFGQYDNLNEVTVNPVLLRKGDTYLSLFGLGCMKDERLFRLFRDKKVTFNRESTKLNDWFNIFVMHQNRVKHGPTNYIPSTYIPPFIHLVLWGHEHECRIDPEIEGDGCYISQPGSSVATSLTPGESVKKFVGVLSVNKKKFQMQKLELKTVRPFLTEDVYTSECLTHNKNSSVTPDKFMETYVETKVKEMIHASADLLSGHPKQPVQPLIRVRIGYDDESEIFNIVRFAQKFQKKVANDDIILFRKSIKKRDGTTDMDVGDLDAMIDADESPDLEGHVEEIVENFFTQARLNNETDKILEVLSEKGLSEGVRACVEKNDKEAISAIVDNQISKTIEYLKRKTADEENIDELIKQFREARSARTDQEIADARNVLASLTGSSRGRGRGGARGGGRQTARAFSDDEEDEVEDDDEAPVARRNGTTSRRQISDDDEDMDQEVTVIGDSDDEEPPQRATRGRGSRGARGAAAASTSARGRGSRGGRGAAAANRSTTTPSRGRGRGGRRGGGGF